MNISEIRRTLEAADRLKRNKNRLGVLDKNLDDYRKISEKPFPLGHQISEMQKIIAGLGKNNQALLDFSKINSSFHNAVIKPAEIRNFHTADSLDSIFTKINKGTIQKLKLINEAIKFNSSNVAFNQNISSTILASSLKLKEIEALQNNALDTLANKQFRNVIKNFQNSIKNPQFFEQINLIRNSFAGNLALAFRDVIESSENQQEALDKVEAIVEEKFAESSDSSFTTQNTLALVISLLSLIAVIYFNIHSASISEESAKLQQIRFDQLLKIIEKSTANITPKDKDIETYYVAEREFDVRANPTFKSMKFGRLFPNTKVKLVARKHKWMYIEWTDYLEGVPRYGWVNKKYLKKLKSENSSIKRKLSDNFSKQKESSLLHKVDEKIVSNSKVNDLGLEVFGDMEKFNLWLNAQNISLGNRKPIELLQDSYGKELVIGELTRINHGILV